MADLVGPTAQASFSHPRRAWHIGRKQEMSADELEKLGCTTGDKDRFQCIDPNCRIGMRPVAWRSVNPETKALYEVPAHFRRAEDHRPGCNGLRSTSADKPRADVDNAPYYLDGYISKVILFEEMRSVELRYLAEDIADLQDEGDPVRRARRDRDIRRASEFYTNSPDDRRARLSVQTCSGRTYEDVFVRLGTGDEALPGRRIYYGEIRYRSAINLSGERIVVPLMSAVWGEPMLVTIDMAGWRSDRQADLRKRLGDILSECWSARAHDKKSRPWIFFVGTEDVYDQVEFTALIEPGLHMLIANMPLQQRSFRRSLFGKAQEMPSTPEAPISEETAPDPIDDFWPTPDADEPPHDDEWSDIVADAPSNLPEPPPEETELPLPAPARPQPGRWGWMSRLLRVLLGRPRTN